MSHILSFAHRWGAPVSAVVFFILWCVAEAGRMGGSFLVWSGALPLVILTLTIAVAAWQPRIALALVGVLLVGQLLYLVPTMNEHFWPMYFGVAFAYFFIIANSGRGIRLMAFALIPLMAGAAVFLLLSRQYSGQLVNLGGPLEASRSMMINAWLGFTAIAVVALGVAWLGGFLLRNSEERRLLDTERDAFAETLKSTEIDLVIEQERTRIARDLHDVLAHSLAVIVAQADGSRYLSRDQSPAVLRALENISGSARKALTDAQHVIEGVRSDGATAPQPGLEELEALIAKMQEGHLLITRTESGDAVDLPAGQGLAIYRIVQESLTNALKHGGAGTDVRIHLDWSGPGLALQIASDPRVPLAERVPAPSSGRGIPGMRERAHLAGGWLAAGPDGDHFRVTAFLPFGPRVLEPAGAGAAGALEEPHRG